MSSPSESGAQIAAGAAEAKRLAARLSQQKRRLGKTRVELVLAPAAARVAKLLSKKTGLPVGTAIARLIVAAGDSEGGTRD